MAEIEKINPTGLFSKTLLNDLRQIIDTARSHVAITANQQLTMMYWHIGDRINREVLGNERAEYGKQIVSMVATQLTELYGKDFSPRNLHRMVQFAQLFPNEEIVSTLSTKLFWSHFMEVLSIKNDVAREFYITLSANNHWGIRQLRKEIDGMLFERTAIDLKLGSFKAQYKGQMELYLRWLEKYEMQPGEETPLGLLLCTEGSDEQISLLQLDKSGIRVAQYLTELPSKEVLLRQLQKSIEAARENMPIENEKQ